MFLALLIAASGPYVTQNIEGWTIQVHPSLIHEHKAEWVQVKREIANQLYRIARVVPDRPLAELRKVPIYASWNDPAATCMAYHPSAEWLREHKFDPAMAKSVQIGHAKNFLSWTYEQPWMILHELAHAYHDRFLEKGFGNERVAAAWKRITESKQYDSVLRWNGKNSKHYALNNPMEYFAETTESYFGRNDFYPFVRAELQTFDPESDRLMQEIWGLQQKR